ncbi:hypothetical protein RvY_11208 [Ramazzottius varieornatus]|uniref:Uncharacterized protein n=1 Tax=Ramazzottius varieornatus TaxID=947166 RepID=A0A1D1VFC9_RAMVA|nr:hypothetical protein RvY_11208 [Ramazzottius varieornatus]
MGYNPTCEIHPDCGCCGMKAAVEWINMTSSADRPNILWQPGKNSRSLVSYLEDRQAEPSLTYNAL